MKRFTIIKNISQEEIVLDLFRNLVGSRIETKKEQDCLVLYYTYENYVDIQDLLLSLNAELMCNLVSYTSTLSEERMDKELKIAFLLIRNLVSGIYTFKTALLSCESIPNKRDILEFILDGTGIDEQFILGFAENDLNVSKASKSMYIHRNTMNYKLDKLHQGTGFDLRSFKDAYILYKLVK